MYWLNEHSRGFLKNGYLLDGVEPEQRIREIAQGAEDILQIEGFADKFYSYMEQGFYSLSSPIWSNFGLERGLPISCYGSYVEDSMQGILDTTKEVGIQSKYGGGTSAYFGDVRGRGAAITNNGESEGSVNFMRLFDTLIDVTRQGSTRRGAFAAYTDIEHKDFDEFMHIKHEGSPIQGIFTGVNVSDDFMQRMMAGDKEARRRWAKVLKSRFDQGLPYIMFEDTANRGAPEVYKKNGLKINNSNLCVAPETLVETDRGQEVISEIAGNFVKVWNGQEFSEVYVEKTGENKELVKVNTKCGKTLDCTSYHKFYVRYLSSFIEKRAWELQPEDILIAGEIVESVVDEGRKDDTYCFTEPKRGMGVFNGLLTGNCSEIMLSNGPDESFVCDLSSLNLTKWDAIVKTDAIETLTYFLDAVMSEFIEKASNISGFENAVNFARNQRALGVGVLGWHDYLQEKLIAFDSPEAMEHNGSIFETIQQRTLKASQEMAEKYGEPELLKGVGRRNVTTTAIAPTTSSAFILGQTSQSIEPYRSNYYVKDLAKAKVTIKNKHLEALLESKGHNTVKVWRSILEHSGSVQHLMDVLTDHEREVFKTFSEISQLAVIQQAAQRQKFIDQSQSLNLMIHPKTPLKDVNQLYITAWELGVKTLYYQHSINAAQAFNQELTSCASCEA